MKINMIWLPYVKGRPVGPDSKAMGARIQVKKRVVVAMSGGVDSCVAAAMLKEAGYDVIGITMQLWNHGSEGESRFDSCCSLSDVHDARLAAHKIGVPHYVVNYEKEFREGVVDYFAAEYAAGRTPNPCVMCNSKLKFDHLVERARALGAEFVATGHYARVLHFEDGRPSQLFRGDDERKDQSYFLFDVKPEYLKLTRFPLAELTKAEVRALAEKYEIHTAQKHESQEICFVAGKRYTDFLDKHYPEIKETRGDIVDRAGNVLGQHEGIHHYTVGQRKGLGMIRTTTPKFVYGIDPEKRHVVVDDLDSLSVHGFRVAAVNWLVEDPRDFDDLTVMPRYRAKPLPCRIEIRGDGIVDVYLAETAKWVTPGQAAVFYQDRQVLGGGFIATNRLKQTEETQRAPNSINRGRESSELHA